MTFASQAQSPNVNWTVLQENSDSDHCYIKIELFNIEYPKEKRLTIMGRKRVLDKLENDLRMQESPEYEIKTANQLERTLDHIYSKIHKLTMKNSKFKITQYKRKNPWWNAE